MGRKIPGRKHRGVKDPEKQRDERLAKIKDKINAAPSNPDDQQIPNSLSHLIELKNKVKQGFFNKKKKVDKEKPVKNKFKGKPEKPIPKFEQRPGETERAFKYRMNKICNAVIRETAFENKYNVDIKRNEEGKVEAVVKRPKDELEVLVKKLKKDKQSSKQKKKTKKSENEQPKLTKSQKWALKKAEKHKKKLSEKEHDYVFEPKKDVIKFGETVHAPPSLVTPRKVEKIPGAPRPGRKQLLLKSILDRSENNTTTNNTPEHKRNGVSKVSKAINKKGKRKDLPNALRRQLDKQQKEVIEAYKKIKLKKLTT